METKCSKDVQKKFSCLFPKGTVMEVMTVASDNDVPNLVKSTGGCYGLLVHGYDFPLETRITTVVIGQHNGMPLLEPTKEWLMSYGPHRARVLFATAQGIAMQLKDRGNQYVHFLCEHGVPERLQPLKSGDEVLAFGLKKIDDDRYVAANVELLKRSPWSQEREAEALANGSYKCFRAIVLGEVYEAEILNDRGVYLAFRQVARLAEGRFPQGIKLALVRVVFVAPHNFQVEFVQALDAGC